MEEKEHLIEVLSETNLALKTNDSAKLQLLSDQTIHSSSIYQHTDYIITAIIIYTLSKIVLKKNYLKIKRWDNFLSKIDGFINLGIKALEENNSEAFIDNLERIRKSITNLSIDIKPYVEEVMRKASINKAAKIYEHGISLSKTADLLGITPWEMAEYIGEKNVSDNEYASPISVESRAKMALDFFNN